MAGTGVLLVLFIVGHMVGNMQVFLGAEVFNNYAHFLQSLGELLWIIRLVLFLALVFHVITSIRLKLLNWSAKPQKYKVTNYVKATLTSRTMIWTGIMVFAFLTYHLLHFTIGVVDCENYGHPEYYEKNGEYYNVASLDDIQGKSEEEASALSVGKVLFERHDVYYMVVKGFQQPLVSIFYIIGVILLGFHLAHAIQSAFQTLGAAGPNFTPWMIRISNIFAFLIVLCYISIPITILIGLVGGSI